MGIEIKLRSIVWASEKGHSKSSRHPWKFNDCRDTVDNRLSTTALFAMPVKVFRHVLARRNSCMIIAGYHWEISCSDA